MLYLIFEPLGNRRLSFSLFYFSYRQCLKSFKIIYYMVWKHLDFPLSFRIYNFIIALNHQDSNTFLDIFSESIYNVINTLLVCMTTYNIFKWPRTLIYHTDITGAWMCSITNTYEVNLFNVTLAYIKQRRQKNNK